MSDAPLTIVGDDRSFATTATLDDTRLTEHDIRSHELVRARRALAYLKHRIGDAAMRRLLADDIAAMTATVRGWVEASAGRWRSAEITLALPGPGAVPFRDWYARVVAERRSAAMRAGHPEHYLNTPGPDGIEVIEPIGETDLPWHIVYRTVDPASELPAAWPADFPVRFAAEIVDGDGLRVGYSLRALRDVAEGMEMRLIACLAAACPDALLSRHLRHFAIEYRNWAVLAIAGKEARDEGERGGGQTQHARRSRAVWRRGPMR